MRSLLLVTLITCTALTGCRKHRVIHSPPTPPPSSSNTLVEGAVIKSTGTWNHSERGTSCSLTTTTPAGLQVNWKYRYSGSRGSGNTSSGMTLSFPTAPWFIYVESPYRLWFFDGSGHLHYRGWNPDDTGDAMTGGTLKVNATDVPSGLVPHLPADLQKLFPAVDTRPRPSI